MLTNSIKWNEKWTFFLNFVAVGFVRWHRSLQPERRRVQHQEHQPQLSGQCFLSPSLTSWTCGRPRPLRAKNYLWGKGWKGVLLFIFKEQRPEISAPKIASFAYNRGDASWRTAHCGPLVASRLPAEDRPGCCWHVHVSMTEGRFDWEECVSRTGEPVLMTEQTFFVSI